MRPVCFVVMPFRTKDTGALPPAPPKVNFDALWEKALKPAIETMGYTAVRADQDLGALIVKEMLERLYFSDLVLADVSIANGNVYYEVGIRHAACKAGCVLIGADWAKPLFDIDQMRQVRYPLPESEVSDATAATVRDVLLKGVPLLAQGDSPMFQSLDGYPNVKAEHATSIRSQLDELSKFHAAVQAIGVAPSDQRAARAIEVRDQYGMQRPITGTVALSVLYALRDFAGWKATREYLDGLPDNLRNLAVVQEQRSLALSKSGNHEEAIGALNELIKNSGPSSEREGLIGGRYKKLYDAATAPADRTRYLSEAIKHYERGMQLDLNDYYPSSNLPRLYRERGKSGDEELAQTAATVARVACERARALGLAAEWLRSTLLGAAFDAGDVALAERLFDEVVEEGHALWKLDSTISDLRRSVGQKKDPQVRIALDRIVQQLSALIA